MSRRRQDHTGIKETCPLIDSVIDFINSCDGIEGFDSKGAKYALLALEEIRSSNLSLRNLANDNIVRADDAEKDASALLKENNGLIRDIRDLEIELRQAH